MPEPVVGHFFDVINNIHERFEAGPPAIMNVTHDVLSLDFKPTMTSNFLVTGEYGGFETVRPGIGAQLLQSGGGMQHITIPYHMRRFTRGDAEFTLYRFLRHMGRTDLGELIVNNAAYDNCWFIGGDGVIEPAWETLPDAALPSTVTRRARFHIRGSVKFVRGMPSFSGLKSPSVPAPPELDAYPGTNLGNYRAIGAFTTTKIGRFSDVASISVERPVTATKIPRAFGMRIKGRGHTAVQISTKLDYRRNRQFKIVLRGFCWAAINNNGGSDPVAVVSQSQTNPSRKRLETRIHDIGWSIRDQNVTLIGNGNNFADCFLESLDIDDDPYAFSTVGFRATFAHSYNEVVFL